MTLRIEEAIAEANKRGIHVTKTQLASLLWPTSKETARRMNMHNLCSGRTIRIWPEAIDLICLKCNCTPNYLFGWSEYETWDDIEHKHYTTL